MRLRDQYCHGIRISYFTDTARSLHCFRIRVMIQFVEISQFVTAICGGRRYRSEAVTQRSAGEEILPATGFP